MSEYYRIVEEQDPSGPCYAIHRPDGTKVGPRFREYNDVSMAYLAVCNEARYHGSINV